jgi:hypothetical protein
MIAGANWWRANEIVIRHPTRQTAVHYHSRDKARVAYEAKLGRPAAVVVSVYIPRNEFQLACSDRVALLKRRIFVLHMYTPGPLKRRR